MSTLHQTYLHNLHQSYPYTRRGLIEITNEVDVSSFDLVYNMYNFQPQSSSSSNTTHSKEIQKRADQPIVSILNHVTSGGQLQDGIEHISTV